MSVEAMEFGSPFGFDRMLPDQQEPEVAVNATGRLLAEHVEVDESSVDTDTAASDAERARTRVEAAFAQIAPEARPLVIVDGSKPEEEWPIVNGAVALIPSSPLLGVPQTPAFDRTAHRVERKAVEPKFGIRQSTREDIDAMVEIDMSAFSKVYAGYETTEDEQREHLREMFNGRFDMIGGKWMPVVTQRNEAGEDEVVGFMHCCPTSKDPTGFVSWEETTNNGKLDTLYDPEGNNVYVVSLSMDPKVKGQRGQNSLFMQQIGTFIGEGMDTAFFESRMPGFRGWVERRCAKDGSDIETLEDTEKVTLAEEYFSSTRVNRNGKEVPLDSLLKVYAGAGCNLLQVLPDAYKDEPSMNFGVLCTFENPLPDWARKSRLLSGAVGGVMKLAAKSSWITRKAFG
jgi:hypothetical protein